MPWPQSGLGAGIANSWIEQYTMQPTPCIYNAGSNAGVETEGTIGSCLLWLLVGAVAVMVLKDKK